jgi:hypothetical protein
MAGGGGAAPPPKQEEELQPHPVRDQLPSVSHTYCINSPPPWRTSLSLLTWDDLFDWFRSNHLYHRTLPFVSLAHHI